jgi:hypothetical protein
MRARSVVLHAVVVCTVVAGRPAAAQQPAAALTPAQQIAAAVLPLPASLRDGAAVYGWQGGTLVQLRAGTNVMRCLADDPAKKNFHVACYHNDLEPFMASGRALAARGLKREQVDSARKAQIAAKRWRMPMQPTMLYELFAADGAFDAATGAINGARMVYVLYVPYATEASSGLVLQGEQGPRPWLMYPGEPWAHIMITP